MTQFEHRVDVEGGYCLLHSNPSKNYGIASCRVFFYVLGPKGAVQFCIGTDWYPKAAREHLKGFPRTDYDNEQPKGWDLGYHAKEPQYEGQEPMKTCHLLGDGKCYYDGSSLNADELIEGFVNGGTKWLWPKLEDYYNHIFEKAPWPDFTAEPRKHPDER